MREIEADPSHQGQRSAALGGERKRPLRLGRRRPRALTGECIVEQPGQEAGDLVEKSVDHRGRAARLVLVEQCLIGAGVEGG